MKTWTIGKRITLGFATLLGIFVVFAAMSWWQTRRVERCVISITKDSLPGLGKSSELIALTLNYRIINLKHIIATNAAEMEALDREADELAQKILAVVDEYKKTVVTPEEKLLADRILPALSEYRTASKHMRGLSMAGKAAEATALIQSVGDIYDAYAKVVTDCRDYNLAAADKSAETSEATFRISQVSTFVGVTLGLLIGVGFTILITRSVATVLRRLASALDDGSNQVASAASQVSSASQSLAEGASEQAASLEETSSSLEEMSSMTRQNTENADKANALARQARTAADVGAADMQAMNAAMEAIKGSSDDIAKIIKTIDEIAFQTNILALNAAVEAARAGEAGMGFAVVADEVRNLAQRCAQSAKETSTKIEGAITRTAQGVEISSKVTRGLEEIVTKARQVDELVAEVASASKEQSQGVAQVNLAMGQMDKVTQSNAATAEESASAAEELNAQAQTLKDAVGELLQLVGGSRGASSVAPAGVTVQKPQASGGSFRPVIGNAPVARKPALKADFTPARNGNHQRDMIPLESDFRNM